MDSPVQAFVRGRNRVGPLLARRYTVVGELPAAMAVPGGRGAGYWPVIQLIKDWNNQPESRASMLAGGLPEGRCRVLVSFAADPPPGVSSPGPSSPGFGRGGVF